MEQVTKVPSDSDIEVDGAPISGQFREKNACFRDICTSESETNRKRDRPTFEEESNYSDTSLEIGVCLDNGERNNSSGSSSGSSSSSSDDGQTGIEHLNDLDISDGENASARGRINLIADELGSDRSKQTGDASSVNDLCVTKKLEKTKVGENASIGSIATSDRHAIVTDRYVDGEEDASFDSNTSAEPSDELDPLLNDTSDIFTQDEDGDTILHVAIISLVDAFCLKIIELMEQSKLNIMNDMLQTPLHLAVLTEQESVVKGLLKARACPHFRDKRGRTPIHIACEKGYTTMLRLFLEYEWCCSDLDERLNVIYPTNYCAMKKSAILNTPNSDGQCCIHNAVTNNDADSLGLLLAHGADINCPDWKSGRTALHLATEQGHQDMVQRLLDNEDLNIDQKTMGDETAIAIAFHRHRQDLYTKLEEKGAKINYKYFAKFGMATAEINKRCKTTSAS